MIAVLSGLLLTPAAGAAAPEPSQAPTGCTEVRQPVTLPGGHRYDVAGELCGASRGRAVHVLLPGITYDRTYWDFPYQPETYSYVRRLNSRGYATLALDLLGTGASSRPPAVEVNQYSNAAAVHQVVQALRRGEHGGVAFDKVILVGHSAGALLAPIEAGTYQDVDGVVVSGYGRGFAASPALVALFGTATIPTQLDPRLAEENYPVGYLTTRPGVRGSFFYDPATSDPRVIERDEQTKDAFTAGILATAGETALSPLATTAPVLVVVGDRDRLVCGTTPCSSPLNLFATERALYPNVSSYEQVIMPKTGHDLNLSTTAPQFYDIVADWSDDLLSA